MSARADPPNAQRDVGQSRERTPVFSGSGGPTESAVETQARNGNITRMKLLCAFAVWIAMGAILGTGILLAVKGSPWLLIAGVVGFVIAVGKIGCLAH